MVIAVLLFAFLSAIGLEVWYSKRHGLNVYDFKETVSHISIVLGQQVINIFAMGWIAVLYVAVQAKVHLLEVNSKSILQWGLVMLASDLIYYVAHRMSHRVNFFIAVHSVHHQAKDFNFASALRLPWFNRVIMFVFYMPFAILGVPVQMIGGAFLVNLVVGSLAHNGVLRRKLGFIEQVFVTPRNHRVHHGIEGKYLDKNFGGVFIFWDKLFGSYQELDDLVEVRLPGHESPDHHDPVRANFDYGQKLFWAMRKRGWGIVFASPEELDRDLKAHGYQETHSVPVVTDGSWPVVIATVILMIGLFVSLAYSVQHGGSIWIQATLACALFFGSWVSGRLIQRLPKPA